MSDANQSLTKAEQEMSKAFANELEKHGDEICRLSIDVTHATVVFSALIRHASTMPNVRKECLAVMKSIELQVRKARGIALSCDMRERIKQIEQY